jgi:hypothetical protein
MLDPKFAFLAAIIDFFGISSYAIDTLKGKTKPNRITWFLWALAPLIAFSAQLSEGVGPQVALTFVAGFGPATVFLASFKDRHAYWRITRFDLICGVLSVGALVLWLVTKNGTLAIIFSILADTLAATPTVIKAYHHPETESYPAFLIGVITAIITLLTIKTWNFATYGFPAYLLVCCLVIFILIKFPKLRVTQSAS